MCPLPQPPKSLGKSLPLPVLHRGLGDLLSPTAGTGVEQDVCEAGRSSGVLGSPPSTAGLASSPARAARSNLGGEQGRPWGPSSPTAAPSSEHHLCPLELPAPEANDATEANRVCIVQQGLGLPCPHLQGMSKYRLISPQGAPGTTRGGINLSLCHKT